MRRTKIHMQLIAASFLLVSVGYALNDASTPAGGAKATSTPETRGIEMSQTSSVVQRGVERGLQLSLEKALDLIARPRPGGGGGGARSAAGIGGGGGRPAGGGRGDGQSRSRMKGNIRQMMDSGS
jgi:hypothetical protein